MSIDLRHAVARSAEEDGCEPAPRPVTPRPLRVAILADLAEERWASMDLVAEMLMRELPRQSGWPVACGLVRPPLVPVLARLRSRNGEPPTADRVFNRFWLYRRALRTARRTSDVFHVVDHSYAHLALALPAGRTVVTCHDIDTFRGFVTPGAIDTGLPRFLVRRLVAGLRRAAFVVCPSQATAEELVRSHLVDANCLVVVPNGVENEPPSPEAAREAAAMLGAPATDILHVGSTVARKRIDLLLHTFARVARESPAARLVRVGGPFTAEQEALASALRVRDRILVLPFLPRDTLLAVYRRAALLLMTSDREGFGLPVAEALAAGLPVIARDLPVLREVGGPAAAYLGDDDPNRWSAAVLAMLAEQQDGDRWRERQDGARVWASRFAWSKYATTMALVYAAVVNGPSAPGECRIAGSPPAGRRGGDLPAARH